MPTLNRRARNLGARDASGQRPQLLRQQVRPKPLLRCQQIVCGGRGCPFVSAPLKWQGRRADQLGAGG
jgi:hypothetical protein